MSDDPQLAIDAIRDHALALGAFESVNGHEPENAPTISGLTAAVWVDSIVPLASASGLDAASGLLVIFVRLYSSANAEPPDAIDPNMLRAMNLLMAAYVGDFEPAGLKPGIDVLNRFGTPLRGVAGYITQDGQVYRVYTLTVPIAINDLWPEVA